MTIPTDFKTWRTALLSINAGFPRLKITMRKLTIKQDELLRKAAATLRKSTDPDLKLIAKHLKGGLEVVNYIFEATDAARKKVPAHFEIEPVGLISTNVKTAGDILAATWLIGIVSEHAKHVIENQTAR